MTLRAVIIADDLTGALDTSTPFVAAGLTVAVAIEPDAVARAIASDTDILAINTASRGLPTADAAACVGAVLAALGAGCPDIVFKKIDSRLKGNVASETEALARAGNRTAIVVAPAIPDQGRYTIAGAVSGRGVEHPLPIRPLFATSVLDVEVVDAESDADLDRLVARLDWAGSIAVGARGLGCALARALGTSPVAGHTFRPMPRTLFAFGSRDPITARQIDRLIEDGRVTSIIDAPAGRIPALPKPRLPAVLRCSGEIGDNPEQVVSRFSAGVSRIVQETEPDMLMMGGGDTALSILRALGASLLMPSGEIEAGVPWFEIRLPDERPLCCAVKSGGFGNGDSLLKLVPENLLIETRTGKPVSETSCGEPYGA